MNEISSLPGEQTFKKGHYIKLRVWHNACVQVEAVEPVVPEGDTNIYS